MTHSVINIVEAINKTISGLVPGSRLYRIAQTVNKDEKTTLPAENEQYIGIDDTYAAQLYHKINNVTIVKQAGGFGDKQDILFTYQMAMIIFLNRNRFDVRPEDLILSIQAAVPQTLHTPESLYINVAFLSANLNDQQVFVQEYKDASVYKLDLNQHLMQLNYNLEVFYRPACVAVCPEPASAEACN